MALLVIIFFIVLALFSSIIASEINSDYFDVVEYGAISDGHTDDSQAFLKAWDAACKSTCNSSTLYVPPNGVFLVNPITFHGPCNASIVNFLISGTIMAPRSPGSWKNKDPSRWLGFMHVKRLRVEGSGGLIDGQGKAWWDQSCRYHPELKNCTTRAPTAWKFIGCNESSVRDVKLINSAQTHILVEGCNNFTIENVTIQTPGTTANTDGIHLSSSQNVIINNSIIACGDDCISIGDSIHDVNISNIECGPGHGISIGSLGRGGSYARVSNINVSYASFNGTSNGARIKTWAGGDGYVRNVTFQYLSFNNVQNPIIIDQHYCESGCKMEEVTGVQISNVAYRQAEGTSATDIAVNFNCSTSTPCRGISMESIQITSVKEGTEVTANCSNAYVHQVDVRPDLSCPSTIVAASISTNQQYDATVSKNKPGAHSTIMDALAAAPTNRDTKYYIHVEAGVYIERVEVRKNLTNIVLVGDGASKTKVQWNRHAPDFNTAHTGTITVEGDGFTAMYLKFENTAGEGFQAAAAVVKANYVAFYKCSFRGYQDTLYPIWGKQFYRECDIYGTVDFICGAAAAVFQSCNLYARMRTIITFTAQNNDEPFLDPKLPSGFVIQNCTLTVAPKLKSRKGSISAYLGRPWSMYSTVVVMESYLDSIVTPAGWSPMTSTGKTDKLVYMECKNRGPGSSTNERVNWSGYHDVTDHPEKVQNFTVGEFINEGDWIGGAGVPYNSGFIYI